MMKRVLLLLAVVGLILHQIGCMTAQPNKPRSLNEWGKLSRPKF